MRNFHHIAALFLVAIALINCGCLKKSITDTKISDAVQAYMDKPTDPSDESLLKPEERAAIESFTIYRNILKVQLVQNTDHFLWSPIGNKMARAFALSCRQYNFLDNTYIVELYVMAEVEGKTDNFNIGKFTFVNRSERVTEELYNITRSKK